MNALDITICPCSKQFHRWWDGRRQVKEMLQLFFWDFILIGSIRISVTTLKPLNLHKQVHGKTLAPGNWFVSSCPILKIKFFEPRFVGNCVLCKIHGTKEVKSKEDRLSSYFTQQGWIQLSWEHASRRFKTLQEF